MQKGQVVPPLQNAEGCGQGWEVCESEGVKSERTYSHMLVILVAPDPGYCEDTCLALKVKSQNILLHGCIFQIPGIKLIPIKCRSWQRILSLSIDCLFNSLPFATQMVFSFLSSPLPMSHYLLSEGSLCAKYSNLRVYGAHTYSNHHAIFSILLPLSTLDSSWCL